MHLQLPHAPSMKDKRMEVHDGEVMMRKKEMKGRTLTKMKMIDGEEEKWVYLMRNQYMGRMGM